MNVDEILKWFNELPTGWVIAVQIFVVIFLAALVDLILRLVLRRMERRAKKTRNVWDDALVYSIRKPLSVFVWIWGLYLAVLVVDWQVDFDFIAEVRKVRDIAIVVMFAWTLIRMIRRFEYNVVARQKEKGEPVDQTTVDAVSKLLRISVFITATLVSMQTMGISVSGIVAFGGIGGLAVGFAAQDLLANFFGGLTIYMERPFGVGDWVRSPDRNVEGVVEHVGWRRTAIRTFDKRPLYVPNSVFNQIALENPSRMLNRRIFETVGVRYDDFDRVAPIVADIREYLRDNEEIDQDQTTMVYFNEFGASSLDFFIYCFTRTVKWAEYHAVKEAVLLKVGEIIVEHGAEIAFPTRTLHVPNGVQTSPGPEGAS